MLRPAMLRPVPIDPTAVYDDSALVLSLDIPSATLARARREGRLRYSRKGRRTYYLGQWVLDWITGGPGQDQNTTEEPARAS
jgi:hypothetical protein